MHGAWIPSLFREPRSHMPAWRHQNKKRRWQLLWWDPHPHFYSPDPWTMCLGRAVSGPWWQRCYPAGCCGSSLSLLPPGFLGVSLGEWEVSDSWAQRGFRGRAACWVGSLFTGCWPIHPGIFSVGRGVAGPAGREEREHMPWQLAVSDTGLACCRTPIVSRVGRDCASRGCPDYQVGGGRYWILSLIRK